MPQQFARRERAVRGKLSAFRLRQRRSSPENTGQLGLVSNNESCCLPLRRDIRLTDQCHTRHRSAFKLSLHRRERDRLVIADYLRLLVARRKRNQERRDQANQRSRAKIKSGLDWMKTAQRVER